MGVRRYIVGVTGGIGSGKTTVANLFSTLGVALVDTDAIAHALTAPDGRAIAAIRSQMGKEFIGNDGALDRAAARGRVFADANVKLQLEAILHPLIREEVDNALRADAVSRAPYAMLVVPLLFESLTYRDGANETLLIDCPVATQLERVKLRPGLNADEAARIVAAQLPRAVRLQLADNVVWNRDTAATLWPQIEPLHLHYVQNASSDR